VFKKSKIAKTPMRRRIERSILVLAVIFVFVQTVPQLLAFPFKAAVGTTIVYSETPIPPEISKVIGQSDALIKNGAIYSDGYGKHIFLTNGGWRWWILALQLSGAFAFTRAISENVIVNISSVKENWVRGKFDIVRQRTLSGVIAHERTHSLIRARFGLKSKFFPTWKVEGYADYVAQESSLTAADVARYKARGINHPAIVYLEGRQKVAAILQRNEGSVDQLFSVK
jgi:hypothetical protein